jgi:multidrug efflux pump subunit AcrA (membrane-fusion protein)
MRRMILVIMLTLIAGTAISAPNAAKDLVTDVKTLEAKVDAAKADLEKARAAALPQWQLKTEYQSARQELDRTKFALDNARGDAADKDKTQATNAYSRAKVDFDKVVLQLENDTEAVVAARKTWEAASKELTDFKRQLAANLKQLDGQRGILAALPRDYWGVEGRSWTSLQKKASNKWLAENVVGRKIRVSGNASSIGPVFNKMISVHLAKPDISVGERKLIGMVAAHFAEGATAELRKLHVNSPVAIEGTVGEVRISWPANGPVEIIVVIESSTLVSRQ